MGYRELLIKLPTDYSDDQIDRAVAKKLKIERFTRQIDRKSLDARKKSDIHWQVRVVVLSDEIKGGQPEKIPELAIPVQQTTHNELVTGSGVPATAYRNTNIVNGMSLY